MFWHNFRYFIKSGFKSGNLMFWMILFPIILGIFFKIAFSDIYNDLTSTEPIPAAIVENEENKVFRSVIDALNDSENKFLDAKFTDENTAMELLKNGEIDGIIYSGEKISLTVAENGIEETTLKEFIEQYNLREKIITDVITKDPGNAEKVISELSEEREIIEETPVTHGNTNNFDSYFYNLIAMSSLYGSYMGINISTKNQANLSALGARKNCSPVPKGISLTAALCGSFFIEFICSVICVTFIAFVLKIDFGNRLPLVYLAAILGGFTGVSFGFFIGSIGNMKENTKDGLSTGIIMTLCYLSGLMVGNMKAVVAEKAPWFNNINPAAVISDSIYCLNIYDDLDRFFTKIITMIITILIFSTLGIIMTRRKRYASL